jgi:hypothetical protein
LKKILEVWNAPETELHVSPEEFSWMRDNSILLHESQFVTTIYNRWQRLRKLPTGTEIKVVAHWDW